MTDACRNKYSRRPTGVNAPDRSQAGRSGMANPGVRRIPSFHRLSADSGDDGVARQWQGMRSGERGRCRFFSRRNFPSFSALDLRPTTHGYYHIQTVGHSRDGRRGAFGHNPKPGRLERVGRIGQEAPWADAVSGAPPTRSATRDCCIPGRTGRAGCRSSRKENRACFPLWAGLGE